MPILIVGAGVAGLYAALLAADQGEEVILLSRKTLQEVSSYWAQGGLAAVVEAQDNPNLHLEDTLKAGRNLCKREAVEILVREAPEALEDLIKRGMVFDSSEEGLMLSLEGGHSRRRIVHAGGSATGTHLLSWISSQVQDHPRIKILEGESAHNLIVTDKCLGVMTDSGPLTARATIFATGGYAALWKRSSNPWGAIGAGSVIAAQAGAELADLEFCQFHPTALYLPGNPKDGFLLTEALRGDGARLVDESGERFTEELAPRDEVAMAIIAKLQESQVYLDLRELDLTHFSNVVAGLLQAGINPHHQPVPVAPAAHYTMGGIKTSLDGETSIPNLFAIGECAVTGLHGANRLASNSLSECFVFARRAVNEILSRDLAATEDFTPSTWTFPPPTEKTRECLWKLAGPQRSKESLEELLEDPYPLAQAIATSALKRTESRGPHRRLDYPALDPVLDTCHTIYARDQVRFEKWD